MINNSRIVEIQKKSNNENKNWKKNGKIFFSLEKISGLFILFCFMINCTDKTKTIGKITEQLDSSQVVTLEIIASYPDSSMFNKVFVKAFVSSTNFDKKNQSWIKFKISKNKFVIAKPFDDNYIFPNDLTGNVILQGKLRRYAEFQNNPHQKNKHRLLGRYWYINDYKLVRSSENECNYVLLVDHLDY
jgi:phosphorylcholine metabolism protein LicD